GGLGTKGRQSGFGWGEGLVVRIFEIIFTTFTIHARKEENINISLLIVNKLVTNNQTIGIEILFNSVAFYFEAWRTVMYMYCELFDLTEGKKIPKKEWRAPQIGATI
ncbi:hypothetical protein ACJX0J_037973, partial [Zea mays]